MDRQVIKIDTSADDGKKFPYFVIEPSNHHVWVIMGDAKGRDAAGYFDAIYASGNSDYRPFEYRGILSKSISLIRIDRMALTFLFGEK